MKQASLAYRNAMNKQFRDRAYAKVYVGVVNHQANDEATLANTSYLSNNNAVFRQGDVVNTYASFESGHTKADGSYLFPPENNELYQQRADVGSVGETIMGSVRINFPKKYDLKGLTIDFGDNYPTEFTVTNGTDSYTYTLDNNYFTCTDTFDKTMYLDIIPISFVSGEDNRLRINYLLMGVGIYFTNTEIQSLEISESVAFVSDELPAINFKCVVLDPNKLFSIDDDSSFINYLIDGQELKFEIGQTLANGTIEYIQMPTTYLESWGSNGSTMTFNSVDRFTLLDAIYDEGNYIHERTLYDDALAVLQASGLESDEYEIDTVLEDITVTNPLPAISIAQCLQLIANAGRCKISQSPTGKILIQGNFGNILKPEELVAYANEEAPWSNASNVRFGGDVIYADFTRYFTPADGSFLFLPENSSQYQLDHTTFVSAEISGMDGKFTTNPILTLELPANFTFHGLSIQFNGNAPSKMTVSSYTDEDLIETFDVNITPVDNVFYLDHSFYKFNKLEFEFTEGYPLNRVLVNQIALGELMDYTLRRFDMKENPVGVLEKRVKDVRVKVFSFEAPEQEGEAPRQVDDDVYGDYTINPLGQTIIFENQLIGTQAHAELIAEWLGNYYANNKTYSVNYRGEPRLDASDLIYMESDKVDPIQVDIEKATLTFDGAFKGKLELRRAANLLEEEESEVLI